MAEVALFVVSHRNDSLANGAITVPWAVSISVNKWSVFTQFYVRFAANVLKNRNESTTSLPTSGIRYGKVKYGVDGV